jgi:hypothetical protein
MVTLAIVLTPPNAHKGTIMALNEQIRWCDLIKLSDLWSREGSSFPEVANTYESWLVIGLSDSRCSLCNLALLIISKDENASFPGDIAASCVQCRSVKLPMDMTMPQQSLLQDRCTQLLDSGIDLANQALETLFHSVASNLAGQVIRPQNLDVEVGEIRRGEEDAPIPHGYRSIAWLRRYEAEAIIYAHKHRKDYALKSSQDQIVFQCNYFPDDSEEFRKFRSNIQAIRINNSNQRVVGWIRLEEARAVIQADESRSDVEFGPIRFGNGGIVQYFSEDLDVVRKYRSTTRLLRKD